ncbi:extracellular solute-binding protein [Nonomuraea sp. NPDC050022]|uniref:ABC transporter substrate-binding protein n=1 Tax=Nonomuraea sp. NPDC050022 TaxID=3364358 RepID=UPI00378AA0DA
MFNRKIAALAAAALTLTACGSQPQASSNDKPKALTIATTSNNQAPMQAVVEAYKKKTGLDINVTVADTAQYQTTLRTQLSSGTAPDVFTVWPGSGNPGAISILQKAGYLADLYAADPSFNDKMAKQQARFADSGWEAAFTKYLEMSKAGCFNADPLGTDVTASYNLVNTGKAVGVVQVLASYSQITSTAPKDAEFGFFPLPGGDSGTNPVPRGIGVSFAVNDKAKNRVNGLGFVDWLATPEAIKVWFDTAPGIPAIQGAEVEAAPAVRAAIDIIAAGHTAPFPDSGWPNAQVQAAHFAGIQQLFSGQADAKQVLASMDEAYAAG